MPLTRVRVALFRGWVRLGDEPLGFNKVFCYDRPKNNRN
jgi:hypothetical protein